MSKKLIVQTVAFGQGRPSLTDATAARFSTPTAPYQSPTHRAAEDRIENEREQAEKGRAMMVESPRLRKKLCARKAAAGGTRAFVEGVGSPHTGPRTIWPMAIIMRALTSDRDSDADTAMEAAPMGVMRRVAAEEVSPAQGPPRSSQKATMHSPWQPLRVFIGWRRRT